MSRAWACQGVMKISSWPRGCAVYSYGVVLWELLTGDVPWVKLHPMQVRPSVPASPGKVIHHL